MSQTFHPLSMDFETTSYLQINNNSMFRKMFNKNTVHKLKLYLLIYINLTQ